MYKYHAGFTLIELVIFMIVSSLLLTTFFLGGRNVLLKSPNIHNQLIATETARMCLEWYLDQYIMKGYSTFTCPSTPTATTCAVPTGFTLSTSITCTTWNSDANYKTVKVTVTGLASASLSVLIGNS